MMCRHSLANLWPQAVGVVCSTISENFAVTSASGKTSDMTRNAVIDRRRSTRQFGASHLLGDWDGMEVADLLDCRQVLA